MPQFRKKPIVIEAVQVTKKMRYDKGPFPDWALPHLSIGEEEGWGNPILIVQTLEGAMRVSDGDWLIQGVNLEVYPCKPDIFEKTYDAVTEP